jgi:hypothetical protein
MQLVVVVVVVMVVVVVVVVVVVARSTQYICKPTHVQINITEN